MSTHSYARPISELIEQLRRLPGIGPKSAQRIAFYLLRTPVEDVERLANSVVNAKRAVRFCDRCCNLAVSALCDICESPRRDTSRLCVVEDPRDVVAFERTGAFDGLYHVLHGALNPLEGIGPEELKVAELQRRLATEDIQEVVLGTNPNLEGEATSMFLAKLLSSFGVQVTMLARGLPAGGDLEYADELTLARALAGRQEFS